MMNFLNQRNPRERLLIIGALILLVFFVTWQFGVKSVLSANAAAEKRNVAAMRNLDIVQAGLPQMTPARATTTRAPFDRAAVINTARESNIAISRVQPGREGELQIWFDDSAAGTVYYFLNRLSAAYNVDIARVQMTRRDGGTISAQLTLKPAL